MNFDHFSREIKDVNNSYKVQNHNIFTSFSPKFFLTIFLVKSKLSTAKKPQTTTFSRVFHPKKIDNFSREIKVEFLDKKWRFRTVWINSLFWRENSFLIIFKYCEKKKGGVAWSIKNCMMSLNDCKLCLKCRHKNNCWASAKKNCRRDGNLGKSCIWRRFLLYYHRVSVGASCRCCNGASPLCRR